MYKKLYTGLTIATLCLLAIILIILIHSVIYIRFSGLPILETILLPEFLFPYKLMVLFLFFASVLLRPVVRYKIKEDVNASVF